ncbi:Uncharacterised protein [Mycobacterium tuberculosis]|nr:Uncharacterised protein [Mycobacterium tuberculosis]
MVGPAGCWVLAGTAAPAGSAPSPVGSGELAEPVGCWPGRAGPAGPADVAFSTTVGSVGLAATPGCCSVPAAPVDPAEPA